MEHENKSQIKVGDIFSNKFGEYKVVAYHNAKSIEIEWLATGYRATAQSNDIRRGAVKDLLCPSIYGVGFIGVGPFLSTENGKVSKSYYTWKSMLQRCYDESSRHKWPSYENCLVCEEWHNFQNFAKWFKDNYIEGYQLDKDILVKNNRTYSPDNCRFVPNRINQVMKRNLYAREQNSLPIGVTRKQKVTARYSAYCCNEDAKQVYVGVYDTPDEAFKAYKDYKERVIKSLANLYRNSLSDDIYNALIDYKVEDTD